MPDKIYVTKTTYEKNATDGIEYFTDLDKLANSVNQNEELGGRVQVFECVPVEYELYQTQKISLYNPQTKRST